MKAKALMVAAALAVGGLAAGSAVAEDQAKPRTAQEQAEAQMTLQTARQLVEYGEAKSDALALVTAAKMMVSIPGKVLADGQTGEKGTLFDIEGVLKKAESMAQGDEYIAKVAADVRKANEANSKWVCYWEYWYGYYYEVCYY